MGVRGAQSGKAGPYLPDRRDGARSCWRCWGMERRREKEPPFRTDGGGGRGPPAFEIAREKDEELLLTRASSVLLRHCGLAPSPRRRSKVLPERKGARREVICHSRVARVKSGGSGWRR